jgi:acetoacetyl-CoA reductase
MAALTDVKEAEGPVDIVIIGASGGIGQYLIASFKGEHNLHGTYCRCDPAKLDPAAKYYPLDVSDRQAVGAFTSELAPKLQRPVLIYATGISPNNLVHKYTDADWDRTLSVNLTGAMSVTRGLLGRMRELNFGRIIYISSVLSRISVPGTVAYSVTKAALCAMARVIAEENSKKHITANSLALGYSDIGIIRAVPETYLKNQVLPTIPIGELGDPANITAAIRFIIDADYFTGATLDINGGMISP